MMLHKIKTVSRGDGVVCSNKTQPVDANCRNINVGTNTNNLAKMW